ncbi:TPA: hypothetical protein DIC38_02355 [Candidatus Nomurabacteria bacterium]|nr:MAG: hypothetical protein O210_OD1C00001G0260 [Parcubacteria bacterium RAAC4_OD1_1]HCY26496.1 hypothetical protein [Candidatus Nomurabacteria bacterium]
MESQTRNCQNCKKDFTIEPEDFLFYEKIKVPAPTFCPECRFQRRFVWRNEYIFYKTNCGFCKKNIITNNSNFNNFPVYCGECWHSDKWDALEYGFDFDFSKDLFTQWYFLLQKTPNINLWGLGNINSDYSNYTGYSKNAYLSVASNCEDVYYSKLVDKSKNLFDCYISFNSNSCYENFSSSKSYNSIFLNRCSDCIDSLFLFDCKNCQNCFMSSGLRNKNFYIRNKQYTKEEYFNKINNLKISSFKNLLKLKIEFYALIKNSIHKFAHIVNSVDSYGDDILNSKNVKNSFIVTKSENAKNCWRIFDGLKDSYDINGGLNNELCYESSLAADGGYLTKFFSHSKGNKNTELVHLCINCSNCFACIGLKNKSYCILNRQYTKEQYEELVPKIIQHMSDMPYIDSKGRVYKYGEFFPSELSPFAYNETIAQEYYPLTKEEAQEQGYKWKDKEERNYTIDIKNSDIPDDINDTDESIVGKVIECLHKDCNHQCTEAFKIIPEEYQFYRRMNLPIPRLCPNCRHYERLSQRNPLKLWHRSCMKEGCTNTFETSYSPDRPEIVYCERCYQNEVY